VRVEFQPASHAVYDVIRQHASRLDEDRPLYEDINTLTRVAKEGTILQAAEEIAGRLN
jgi:histidine ammonia-lyase